MALPEYLGASNLDLPGLSPDELFETYPVGRAVKSHVTSTSGYQVAVQAEGNSVLPSPPLGSSSIDKSAILSEKRLDGERAKSQRMPIACTQCASAKAACDKKNPCSRCVDKKLTCDTRFARRSAIYRQDNASLNEGKSQLRCANDTSASDSSAWMPDISSISPSSPTARSLFSTKQYYSNGSTALTFSTAPDSAYASYDSYDPGYYSQLLDPPEDSTDPAYTGPPLVVQQLESTMTDTDLVNFMKFHTFLAPKGQQPYFQLKEEYKETPETQKRVYLDLPKNAKKGEYPCRFPGSSCSGRAPFRRPADLERHYQNSHVSAEAKEQFPCDYTRCTRHLTPFTRKDYLRNHLKDYHKEDLGRAQGHRTLTKKAWETVQKNWLDERQINVKWWRCSKCLDRIQIAIDGFECRHCRSWCEEERRDRINALNKGKEVNAISETAKCEACKDTAWIWNDGTGAWAACQKCQPAETYDDIDEGLGC